MEVGTIKIQVGRALGAVEERRLLEDRGDAAGGLLQRIHLDAAIKGVRQFEGRGQVALDAAVVGVGQRGERKRRDVVPEDFHRIGHRFAGGGAADVGRPGFQLGVLRDLR